MHVQPLTGKWDLDTQNCHLWRQTMNVPDSSSFPWPSIVEHNKIWYRTTLWSVWVSYQSCAPSQHLVQIVDRVKREKKKAGKVGRLGGAWGKKKRAWWMLGNHSLAIAKTLLSTLIKTQTQSTAPGRLVKNIISIPDRPSTHFHIAKHWTCFMNRNSLFYIFTSHATRALWSKHCPVTVAQSW